MFVVNVFTLKTPGATLLNDHHEIVGIASEFVNGNLQIFVRLSDYISWIEQVVWPSENVSTTTEDIHTWSSGNGNIETETTSSSDDSIALSPQIVLELHDIHMFLNANFIVIVLILIIVLCISGILWSDGLCSKAVLPDQCTSSNSTAV